MTDNEIADSALGSVYRAAVGILLAYGRDLGSVESLIRGGYGAISLLRRIDDPKRTAADAETMLARLGTVFAKAYRAEQRRPQRFAQIEVIFDAVNPDAVAFLRSYSLDLVRGLDDDARAVIRAELIRGQTLGVPPKTQARIIESAIGLAPRDAAAISRLTVSAYRQAIDNGASVAQAERKAASVAKKAGDKRLRYRAETIARTETIRAQHAGTQTVWNERIRDGLLPREMLKQWIVTPDDRLCMRICRPMDGVKTGITEVFDTPAGAVEYPPAHPRCRCSMGLARP